MNKKENKDQKSQEKMVLQTKPEEKRGDNPESTKEEQVQFHARPPSRPIRTGFSKNPRVPAQVQEQRANKKNQNKHSKQRNSPL